MRIYVNCKKSILPIYQLCACCMVLIKGLFLHVYTYNYLTLWYIQKDKGKYSGTSIILSLPKRKRKVHIWDNYYTVCMHSL